MKKTLYLLLTKLVLFTVSAYGNVLYTFDLSCSNTIQIQDGKICVQAAECPDQTCVHMGYLSDSGLPIVCLPNRLVIQFSNAELDGIAN